MNHISRSLLNDLSRCLGHNCHITTKETCLRYIQGKRDKENSKGQWVSYVAGLPEPCEMRIEHE